MTSDRAHDSLARSEALPGAAVERIALQDRTREELELDLQHVLDTCVPLVEIEVFAACEFCDAVADPLSGTHHMPVCAACWNKANDGSGWMQRALKADQEVSRLTTRLAVLTQELQKEQEKNAARVEPGATIPPTGSTAKSSTS